MEIIFIIVAVLASLLLIKKIVQTKARHRAAANVMFAKYTYLQLPRKDQERIHQTAVSMIGDATVENMAFANDVQRYGWYALAMDRLNIPSAVPDNPKWYTVKNPYSAIKPGDLMLRGIAKYLKREYDLDVTVTEKNQ